MISTQPPEAYRDATNLVNLLRWRAQHQPDGLAYVFINDSSKQEIGVTYAELDRQARAVGALLQKEGASGKQVLLLLPPGLEYIAMFYGCFYAGAVAVPAYPPKQNRSITRIESIVADAHAVVALTTQQIYSTLSQRWADVSTLENLRWIIPDLHDLVLAESWQPPQITEESLALLQYTSGSTGTPKGVMVTHRNLMHNAAVVAQHYGLKPSEVSVSWLPPYHDMGLGTIIQALLIGFPLICMSPATFLQHPFLWLEVISRHKAATSVAPNFAYDLCSSKITPEQLVSLDLSSWRLLLCGSEPIRSETMERFAQKFAPCGLRAESLSPCYGLAEATLFISGEVCGRPPLITAFQRSKLAQRVAIPIPRSEKDQEQDSQCLVGCGHVADEHRVVIVDPDTLQPCRPDHIGEIWIASESVARGYWQKEEETERSFRAYTAEQEGPFLRTGDLGFLYDEELYVTGRLKDVIILRGRNYYPQDIEFTVEKCHPLLRPGCGAALAMPTAHGEQLAIVYEVVRRYEPALLDEVVAAIRRAVAQEHDIEVSNIALIKITSVPKTSSGKIRRRACLEQLLEGSLEIVGQWSIEFLAQGAGHQSLSSVASPLRSSPSALQEKDAESVSTRELTQWLCTRIAQLAHIEPHMLDVRQPLANFGLDSVALVGLSGEMEEYLGRKLSPTLLYEYPTIETFVHHLTTADRTSVLPHVPTTLSATQEPIAIIGIGCRFPGAANKDAFWQLLNDGGDAIIEVPMQRWDLADFYDANPATPGKVSTRWGGFLEQVDQFDPHFFNISPREATRMDPQQRLIMEVAWEALEDAGQTKEQLVGSQTGVFIGISSNDYSWRQFSMPELIDAYAGTGNAHSISANRLSYTLDLRGPSLAIDTACSSSLVAVHLACQSIHNGECSLALAGGVNILLSPAITINFSKAGAMAEDGRCKAFDARADGYVRSEGAGVVILKSLAQALEHNDHIYAIIKGSATNQDGRTNGLMAPNPQAQEAVLLQAYQQAQIQPCDVQYIETHGTGTLLGDSIEAKALGTVLARGRTVQPPCKIGSVKTNIGHLEAAAGIAGLIKVALSLHHRTIPKNLHFQQPNPQIPFEAFGIEVQQTKSAWPSTVGAARAGASSFGFGGTNAHVVLEEAPVLPQGAQPEENTCGTYLLPISAHNPAALQQLARSYHDLLAACIQNSDSEIELTQLCAAAAIRRSHHDFRLACVFNSAQEGQTQLTKFQQGESCSGVFTQRKVSGQQHKVVFVFPGQGSQWVGMGQDLLQTHPNFRKVLLDCDEIIRRLTDWSLLEVLQLPEMEQNQRLEDISIVQPILCAIQIALAELWQYWGIKPDALVGHSMGEIAASYVAGILSLEDALTVICARSRLLKRISGQGAMLLIERTLEEAQEIISGFADRISVAVSNSPRSTVLSGDPEALQTILQRLEHQGCFCRWVKVNVASHSPQVDVLRTDLLQMLDGIQPQIAALPLYSTVTCSVPQGTECNASYWIKNLREPVRFSDVIQQLISEGYDTFIEQSPHPLLLPAIQEGAIYKGAESSVALPSLKRDEPSYPILFSSLSTIYSRGGSVAWQHFYPQQRYKAQLPLYPWQRERCWFDIPEHVSWEQRERLLVSPALSPTHYEHIAPWLYELTWHLQERRVPSTPDETKQRVTSTPQYCLIFADDGQVGTFLASQLEKEGIHCVLVSAQNRYAQLTANHYAMRPGNSEDVQTILKHIMQDGQVCTSIIHLWSLNVEETEHLQTDTLQKAQQLTCLSVLHIVQALAQHGRIQPPRLWLVTRNAQRIALTTHPQPALSIAQAPLWGLGQTIAAEHPMHWGGLLDLDAASSDEESARLILQEIQQPDGEDLLAFRMGMRYGARLVRHTMQTQSQPSRPGLRTDGTYLITGGLGGLGLQVAHWLIAQGARRLILLGRTTLPPRRVWRQLTPQHPYAAKVAAIQALEAAGASIHLAAIDVADEEQVRSYLEDFNLEGWPPIRGVIHAAGVTEIASLTSIGETQFVEISRSKVQGSWLLHQLLKDAPLDFFVVFSSFSTLLSSPGLGHYASANAFLDALAHYRQQLGMPALSINWAYWSEIGMTARYLDKGHLTLKGIRDISPRLGLEILGYLLARDVQRVGVIGSDWETWSQAYPSFARKPLFTELLRADTRLPSTATVITAQETLRREELLAIGLGSRRRKRLEKYVSHQIAQVLGRQSSEIDSESALGTLGIDSLMSLEIRNRLEAGLGLSLSATLIWNYPTVAALVEYLAEVMDLSLTDSPPQALPMEQKPVHSAQLLSEIEKLSEEDAETLLAQQLALLEGTEVK